MRKILVCILILCNCTDLFSQALEQSIIPWGKNTLGTEGIGKNIAPPHSMRLEYKYMVAFHKNGKQKYIFSTDFLTRYAPEQEIMGTGPWQGNITISPSSINYEIIAKEVLKPYYNASDSSLLHIAAFYDLDGNFIKFELEVPTEVDIPEKAMDELASRLKKESRLQLEFDPEKAKYVNYITLSTIPLYTEPDDYSKIEYEKADSNTYVIKTYTNTKYINNVNNPYEGIGTAQWRGRVKILSIPKPSYSSISEEVLAPYIDKYADWLVLGFFDLNGDLQYFILRMPVDVNIPIKVIEKLESRLKKEAKLKLLIFDPETAKYVNYIILP